MTEPATPPTEPIQPTTLTPEITPPVETTAAEEPKVEEPQVEEKAEEFIPLTAEKVKLPEGLQVEAPVMEKFLGILNDREGTAETRAQSLIDLQAEVAKSWSEKATADWDAYNTKLVEEVKADPEVGGAKLDTTLRSIATLIDTHGSPELRTVFDDSGAGNSLPVVKFMNKIAGLLAEGTAVSGNPVGTSEATQASKMFPSMKG